MRAKRLVSLGLRKGPVGSRHLVEVFNAREITCRVYTAGNAQERGVTGGKKAGAAMGALGPSESWQWVGDRQRGWKRLELKPSLLTGSQGLG